MPPEATNGEARANGLRVLSDALRLASRFVAVDNTQLAGQLLARVAAPGNAGLARLLAAACKTRVPLWLRPLGPSLVETGGTKLIFSGHGNSVQALATTPDGCLLVSASWDRTVRVWNLANGPLIHVLEGHDEYVESVAVTVDGTRAVSRRRWHRPRLGPQLGDNGRRLRGRRAGGRCCRHPDVEHVAVATRWRVMLWSLDSGRASTVVAADVTPGERSKLEPAQLKQLMTHNIVSLAVGADGGRLFVGRADGRLEWWDLAGMDENRLAQRGGGEPDGTTLAHSGPVWAIACTPDGTAVVSGGEDGLARIWEVRSGALRCTLEGHGGGIRAVTVTPDAARVLTGSRDASVRVWDSSTGDPVDVLKGHSDGVYSVVALPDGSLVTSGSGSDYPLLDVSGSVAIGER